MRSPTIEIIVDSFSIVHSKIKLLSGTPSVAITGFKCCQWFCD